MTFFDWAIVIGFVALALAAMIGTISVVSGLRPRGVYVRASDDCRETALIMHGEGVRADCN